MKKENKMDFGVSFNRMNAIFDIVTRNMDNWKDPIRGYITKVDMAVNNWTVEDIIDAVDYFTATTAEVVAEHYVGDEGYRVTAPGYYNGPAN
jgi:hypothetical protein